MLSLALFCTFLCVCVCEEHNPLYCGVRVSFCATHCTICRKNNARKRGNMSNKSCLQLRHRHCGSTETFLSSSHRMCVLICAVPQKSPSTYLVHWAYIIMCKTLMWYRFTISRAGRVVRFLLYETRHTIHISGSARLLSGPKQFLFFSKYSKYIFYSLDYIVRIVWHYKKIRKSNNATALCRLTWCELDDNKV